MKTKILIAEDEGQVRELLGQLCKMWGYEAVLAKDTDEALQALEREVIDIVLTDDRMPGEGGLAVVRRSKQLKPNRVVIVSSGTAKEADCLDAGADICFPKPYVPSDLRALLNKYLKEITLNDLQRLDLEVVGTFEVKENDAGTWQFFKSYHSLFKHLESTMKEEMRVDSESLSRLPFSTKLGPRATEVFLAIEVLVKSARS